MNDQHLHDAFAEYERQADAVSDVRSSDHDMTRHSRGPRTPLLLVAASVVLVLAIAGAVVFIAHGTSGGSGPNGQQAGGSTPRSSAPSVPATTSAAPGTSTAPSSIPDATSSAPGPGSTLPATSTTPAAPGPSTVPTRQGPAVPKNAAQMSNALGRVVGRSVNFVVNEHQGNYLKGVLINTATGHRGGFDIQAYQGSPGDEATCEDPGKHSHCRVVTLANGGSLVRESETYNGGKDVLCYVNYVFPNGATFLMHVSNRQDPKGAGKTYGPKPPLTLQQMVNIVESSRW